MKFWAMEYHLAETSLLDAEIAKFKKMAAELDKSNEPAPEAK